MTKTSFDIDWEIQQLSLAIDYYEQAIESSFSASKAMEYESIVMELNNKIKELERKRDEYEQRQR